MHRRLALLLCLALSFLGGALEAAEPSPKETLAANAPRATPAGVTFTAPSGWSLSGIAGGVVLEAPEADSHLAIVDSDAPDAAAAVEAAWKAYNASAQHPLKLSNKVSPRNGWEERHTFQYETSPNEKATVFAIAQRAGSAWSVILVEASDATYDKRRSQFGLTIASARPKGYQRESFAGRKAHPLDAARIETLRKFVADGMEKLDIPGVGLAFIDGGKVVWEGGVGVKELGKPAKVDKDTLFIAASNTKAMTTLLLAELVDEKKLRWDEPVTEAYPTFKLGDAETTRQVLIKHLICACTGMPRQDLEFLFEFRDATPRSSIEILGTMQPTSGFGKLFQYSNLMAAAAGFVGGHLVYPKEELGAAYDEAMRRKVFEPLGMTRTTFDFKRALAANHASPHGDDVDGIARVARMDLNYAAVPVRPAGGVWTSSHDLSRYVMMELAKGKLANGKQLVSEENLLARRAPQVAVSEDVTYGMGLIIDTQWGIPVVHHGGDLIGYHSDMIWLPDHNVGAVILTNADAGTTLRGALLRRMLEVLFDGKPEAQPALDASAAQIKATRAKERERLVIPADAAAGDKLAAHYTNASLGGIDVKHRGKDLVFDFGEWASTVASRRNDDGTTSFITVDPTVTGFEFVVAERDGKPVLVIRDAQHEYVFAAGARR